jgi:hypothetical protein
MASIDDVYRNVNMLLDALFRARPDGMTGGMGQVGSFPGVAPSAYHAAQQARDASAETLTVAKEISRLLNAVNVETLGRIEARIDDSEQKVSGLLNAVNVETLGRIEARITDGDARNDRIESDLKEVMQFLPTVRADMNDLSAKLDTIVAERQQDMTDLNVKLGALKAEIQALPH